MDIAKLRQHWENWAQTDPLWVQALGRLPLPLQKAEVQVIDCPREITPGSQVNLKVRLRNASAGDWPALGTSNGKFQIKIGSQWRRQTEEPCAVDGSGTILPADLKAGEEVVLPLLLTAPIEPGDYTVETGVVQQGAAWFADQGSGFWRGEVRVAEKAAAQNAPGFAAEIQMHGIPLTEGTSLIENHGGNIVQIREDGAAGDHFQSFSYTVVKARSAVPILLTDFGQVPAPPARASLAA